MNHVVFVSFNCLEPVECCGFEANGDLITEEAGSRNVNRELSYLNSRTERHHS